MKIPTPVAELFFKRIVTQHWVPVNLYKFQQLEPSVGEIGPCRCAILNFRTASSDPVTASAPQAAALRTKGGCKYNQIQTSAPQEAKFMVKKTNVCPVPSCPVPLSKEISAIQDHKNWENSVSTFTSVSQTSCW